MPAPLFIPPSPDPPSSPINKPSLRFYYTPNFAVLSHGGWHSCGAAVSPPQTIHPPTSPLLSAGLSQNGRCCAKSGVCVWFGVGGNRRAVRPLQGK